MTLKEILGRFHDLSIHEQPVINDDYCELVILNKEIGEWNRIFTDLLGPPRKPKGTEPSEGDLNLTKASGGIRINQTLFEKKIDGVTIIAKFWPWENDIYTTLKMALLY
jgi:hypothetical protein